MQKSFKYAIIVTELNDEPMDPVLLKIYLKDSCFFLEKETESALTISQKNSEEVDSTSDLNFWKNLISLIDYEPLLIDLNGSIDPNIKILRLFCILRMPKLFRNKKTNTYYIKSFMDMKFINEFKQVGDTLGITTSQLSDFGFIFSKERVFDDYLDEKYITINFCVYIPIKSINKISILT